MPQFRFTKETPPQQLFNDIQNLNALSDDQFGKLIDTLLSFIAGEINDLMEAVTQYAQVNKLPIAVLKNTTLGTVFFLRVISIFVLGVDFPILGIHQSKLHSCTSQRRFGRPRISRCQSY
jgi:hypothetical protein